MLLIDLGLSVAVSVILTLVLLRFVHAHGPWRKPMTFPLVIFLFAWAGGAWVAPGLSGGWVTYWIPFVLVGLVTAVLIVSVSPRHDLRSQEDVREFEREQTAVLLSVTLLMWILLGLGAAAIIAAYLR